MFGSKAIEMPKESNNTRNSTTPVRDLAHNPQNSCRSLKMMVRNDINAQRSLGFEDFLLTKQEKNRNFLENLRFLKKMQHFH